MRKDNDIFCIALLVAAFFCVVVHFYDENYKGAECGDEVGHQQRDVVQECSLHYEEDAAEAHHAEGAEGDAFGIAGADGDYGLGQVAEDHAHAGEVAYYGGENFHSIVVRYIGFIDKASPRLLGRGRFVWFWL